MWFKRLSITVLVLLPIFLNTNITSAWWLVETLDSNGDVFWYTSLVVDSQDKVHISYYDNNGEVLKYITDATGSWVAETLDSSGGVGRYSSIAVDSSDKRHISYSDVYVIKWLWTNLVKN
jgi:hypothetical protein